MNLGKLLGAGKSFFSGHGMVSYRKNRRVYLPKFNDAENNPFAPKLKEVVAVEVKPVSAPVAVMPLAPAKVIAEVSAVNVAPAPKPVAAKAPRAGWGKLNPFKVSPPVATLPVAAVQPEFSLDAVKVLHNDLSDADVEVVPVKSRVSAPTAKAAGPADYMSEPMLRTI
ncbi:MAG TPA: hypothetical protein VG347_00255 [Verrucomicrobiae bacterium]|nr:hypothetical protein [Verrucomicrobiae bacterium]